MGVAIETALPKYGMKTGFLRKECVRNEGAFSFAITWRFCSLCNLLHPNRPCLVRRCRKISWRIRSMVDGNRFNTPTPGPSSSSGGPRLIRVLEDLRRKVAVKIQEIKKGLPMKLFFLLVGFYCATAFSTVIGQTGDWDVLSAAFAVLLVECVGALMYRASIPPLTKARSLITMFNYWKTGLAFGLFLDSFKYEADNIFGLSSLFNFELDMFSSVMCFLSFKYELKLKPLDEMVTLDMDTGFSYLISDDKQHHSEP